MYENKYLNTAFKSDLDTNFEYAYNMCETTFSHNELLGMLKNGNVPEREIAALKFDFVKTQEDALALINSLTGCDGKIREAAALKINQILLSDKTAIIYFAKYADVFAKGTIDINANICRLVVDSAVLLKADIEFSLSYSKKIVNYTKEALQELDKFIFRDKKYVINKQLFKLYWCLEAIKYFYEYIEDNILEEILQKCAQREDYTIREKTAQILSNSQKYPQILKALSEDDNYYVRAAIKSF